MVSSYKYSDCVRRLEKAILNLLACFSFYCALWRGSEKSLAAFWRFEAGFQYVYIKYKFIFENSVTANHLLHPEGIQWTVPNETFEYVKTRFIAVQLALLRYLFYFRYTFDSLSFMVLFWIVFTHALRFLQLVWVSQYTRSTHWKI